MREQIQIFNFSLKADYTCKLVNTQNSIRYMHISGIPKILHMCMHILLCVLCVCVKKKKWEREEYVLRFVPTSSYATVNPALNAFT